MTRIVPVIDRIMRRVDASVAEACWLWSGSMTVGGYGVIRRTNRRDDGMVYAHRAAYEHYVGPIPEGLVIDHLCRVRNCVNPTHLEPVTARENILRGESHVAANVSKTQCPQGHPYNEANTYHYRGARQCRMCRDVHRATWRAKGGEDVSSTSRTRADLSA